MISLRLAVIIRRLQWLACAWISLDDYSGITGQFAFIPTIANRLIWCGSEACCIILQPVSSPAGKDSNGVDELGTGIDAPMVGRSAPRQAEVGILIGRIRSLVVKT